MRKELLIGCGSRYKKIMSLPDHQDWNDLVTLDNNEDHKPDVVWDLMNMPLPFKDNEFDEIHAYDVLEHTGQQGDYKFFFSQWNEFYRILKPDGHFFAKCPSINSVWAWGDPSHTRVIQQENLVFLSQDEYTKQIGKTPMSDFRYLYESDFETEFVNTDKNDLFFVLRAVKPSRISYE